MDTENALVQTVAAFAGVAPEQVGPDFALSGAQFQGSVARTRLYAAIQRYVGVKCQAAYNARTFGELQAAVMGNPLTTDAAGAVQAQYPAWAGSGTGVVCGIDIEHVSAMHETSDYWSDPFYSRTFAPSEIAYCVTQEQPRMHFAARWSAKEALKKCEPRFAGEELSHFEVAFEGASRPFLRRLEGETWTRLPFALSLSHTAETAVAVVMGIGDERTAPAPTTARNVPRGSGQVQAVGGSPSSQRFWNFILFVIAAFSLFLSILALLRR